MALSHVSDEEILEYLDGNLTACELTDFQNRLKNCPLAQEKLREYLILYKVLKMEQVHGCSPTLVDSIMRKLPVLEYPKKSFWTSKITAGIIGLVVLIAITHYFIDLTPLVNQLAKFPLFNLKVNWEIFTPPIELVQKFSNQYYLFGFAILVLLLVKVVDFMLLETKYRKIES
ncbi:MAG: hypothetical protein PHU88_02745 [candidate division Zixibacteria bacterium]|nr:hypothetical protein [candidate division Zixibacteria bacterium]MDD5425715.1 hypothetical protein [candidate division Zixibacteria bacterium]